MGNRYRRPRDKGAFVLESRIAISATKRLA
jgi:hypothetical protein